MITWNNQFPPTISLPNPLPPDHIFTNLDGEEVKVGPGADYYIRYLLEQEWIAVVQCRGTLGATELAMHTRKVDHRPIVAFLQPGGTNYAYVLLHDGSILDGCFHQFEDGSNPLGPVGGQARNFINQAFVEMMNAFADWIARQKEDAFDTLALARWADDGGPQAPLDREPMI